MEETLRDIWNMLGVPQLWGAILTVILVVIAFLLKKLLDQRMERRNAELEALAGQFTDVAEFVKEQSVGLIKAYVMIFERQDAIESRGGDFSRLVMEADNELMKPFRRYQAKIDDETKSKIFMVHNILAQYYPDASKEAIDEFKTRKLEFYVLIDEALKAMRPDNILYRLGLVSRQLQRKRI